MIRDPERDVQFDEEDAWELAMADQLAQLLADDQKLAQATQMALDVPEGTACIRLFPDGSIRPSRKLHPTRMDPEYWSLRIYEISGTSTRNPKTVGETIQRNVVRLLGGMSR